MQKYLRRAGLALAVLVVAAEMFAATALTAQGRTTTVFSTPATWPTTTTTSTTALDGGDPNFPQLPVGATLPTEAECAQRVHAAGLGREVRPENADANHSTPTNLALPPWPDYWAPPVNKTIVPRIDGQFVGSTDEIIAWGSCKWGIDANYARAIAVTESYWRQSQLGDFENNPADCVGTYQPPCPTSFGLLQIKHIYRPGSWPNSQEHTAFNVDYGLAVIRGCYEGYVTYLHNGYGPGDIWGCAGWHYSGQWMNQGAMHYIAVVQKHFRERPWLTW